MHPCWIKVLFSFENKSYQPPWTVVSFYMAKVLRIIYKEYYIVCNINIFVKPFHGFLLCFLFYYCFIRKSAAWRSNLGGEWRKLDWRDKWTVHTLLSYFVLLVLLIYSSILLESESEWAFIARYVYTYKEFYFQDRSYRSATEWQQQDKTLIIQIIKIIE